MRESQPEGAPAPRRRSSLRGRPWRYAMIFLVLSLALVGLVQRCSRAPAQAAGADVARANALIDATRLIVDPPYTADPRVIRPITGTSPRQTATLAGSGADDMPQNLPHPAADPIRLVLPAIAPGRALTENTPRARQAMPAADAQAQTRTADTAQSPAPRPAARPGAAQRFLRHTVPNRSIPVAIEDGKPAITSADALSGLAIRSDVKTRDARDCPFALAGVAGNEQQPLAQLRTANAAPAGAQALAWFAVGASPLPGWRVLSIRPDDVVLLDPQGGVLHLRGRDPPGAVRNDRPAPQGDTAVGNSVP